jgi:hypothetical protein
MPERKAILDKIKNQASHMKFLSESYKPKHAENVVTHIELNGCLTRFLDKLNKLTERENKK